MPYKDKQQGKEHQRKYYLDNREKIIARSALVYENNKEEKRAYSSGRYFKTRRLLVIDGKPTQAQLAYWERMKGTSPANKGQKGVQVAWNKGKPWSDEVKAKLSAAKTGKAPPNKGKPGPLRGERCWNWKGGVSSEAEKIRKSLEYKLWRRAVFHRDNYTCVWCGARSGNGKAVVLNADHIKPFSAYPELRFDVENGRTLCCACHKKTETYGRPKKILQSNDYITLT